MEYAVHLSIMENSFLVQNNKKKYITFIIKKYYKIYLKIDLSFKIFNLFIINMTNLL